MYLVNLDLLTQMGYSSDYLYQKVNDGTFTVDTVLELSEQVASDINGYDMYGYAGTSFGLFQFLTGAGQRGIYLTDSGFDFDVYSDLTGEILDIAYQFRQNSYVNADDWSGCGIFQSGNALFTALSGRMKGMEG